MSFDGRQMRRITRTSPAISVSNHETGGRRCRRLSARLAIIPVASKVESLAGGVPAKQMSLRRLQPDASRLLPPCAEFPGWCDLVRAPARNLDPTRRNLHVPGCYGTDGASSANPCEFRKAQTRSMRGRNQGCDAAGWRRLCEPTQRPVAAQGQDLRKLMQRFGPDERSAGKNPTASQLINFSESSICNFVQNRFLATATSLRESQWCCVECNTEQESL